MKLKHEEAFIILVAVIFTALIMVLVVAFLHPDYFLKLVIDGDLKEIIIQLLSSLLVLL